MLAWAGKMFLKLAEGGKENWIIIYTTNASVPTQLSLVIGPSSSSRCQILPLQAAFALSQYLEAAKPSSLFCVKLTHRRQEKEVMQSICFAAGEI